MRVNKGNKSAVTFYEVDGHFQAVRVLVAIVQYERADFELGPLLVDLIERVQHRLDGLYTALGHDLAARELRVFARMNHH